jgi:hypothetical protein
VTIYSVEEKKNVCSLDPCVSQPHKYRFVVIQTHLLVFVILFETSAHFGLIFFTNRFVGNFLQITYKSDICPLIYENHIFFSSINKKICDSHLFKGHMSLLYIGRKNFPTNRFVGNFYRSLKFKFILDHS